MPVFILSLIIQVALVVHIVKTGRSTTWIWIVVMLPLAGSLAYVIVEILPGIMGGRAGRKVKKNVEKVVNPNKSIQEAVQDFSVADTVENSIRLAEECINNGMFDDAKQLYEKCLKGVHESDPYIMHGLAKAEFGLKNFSQVKSILDKLIAENPDFKDAAAHLLYARTAEALNDTQLALQEYEVLDGYYPGPEATYHYALLLKNMGDHDKAKALIEKILHKSKTAGNHYNAVHEQWISLAKNELSD